jgi:hypothetical protein
MKWRLETRRGKAITAGTLEQVLTYLKYMVPDGDYSVVGPQLSIPARRHQGVVYPFDQWEGWQPGEAVKERRTDR